MKQFVWRLQRVLEIKTKQEQTKRAELLELTGRLARTRRELLTEQRKLEDLISVIAAKNSRQRLSEQELFLKCSLTNNELINKLKDKIKELELLRSRKTAEVLKVRRFRKSLEKLRAEAKTQFIKEQEKLEQKESDQNSTIGFARKIIQRNRISR
jgi:flagellar biosynthesis chaperone FliJ